MDDEMSEEIFEDVRRLIAKGSIEPALAKIGNLVEGARGDMGDQIATVGILLSQRFSRYRLDRLGRTRPAEELDRQLNQLVSDALEFISLVESHWDGRPRPAIGPAPRPSEVPRNAPLADPREALLDSNPLRKVAWLQKGLDVARAVCKIRTPEKLGTGFLLRGGRIVTNNHVLPSESVAKDSFAIFNFEEDLAGRPATPVPIAFAGKTLKTNADPKIDCTVVGLDPTANLSRWGVVELNCSSGPPNTCGVSIIQHPDGAYKQIAVAGNVISGSDDKALYYVTSTMKGSSGAPVFDDDWRVIALHQGGGEWSEQQRRYVNNKGIRLSAISDDPVLGQHLGTSDSN